MQGQGKVRVAYGDEVEMMLAKTDVTHHLKVAGHVRTVLIGDDGRVRILGAPAMASPYQPSFEDVGVHRDDDGLYVDPLPDRLVQVFHHGKPVSPRMVDDGVAYSAWLMKHQGQSPDYAVQFGGYEVKMVQAEVS